MELKILSFDGKLYSGEYARVSLPTNDGIRTILDNHMDVVVPVEIGEVKLINGKERKTMIVSEGIFNFEDNKAQLLVRTFESTDEIDQARAQRAKERAEKRLKEEKLSTKELRETELSLKRAITRLGNF